MLPHFAHFTRTLSIHGLCNSKFGPSGSFDAASTISFLENNRVCLPQSLQSHIGRGHPQNLSREIHHGCFSLIIPNNGFLCLILPIFTRAFASLRSSTIFSSASLTNRPSYFPASFLNLTSSSIGLKILTPLLFAILMSSSPFAGDR